MEASHGPNGPTPPDQPEPPPPTPQDYGTDDGMFAGWALPEQFDFLRNRFLLAGLGVLAVLLLTAIVLVVLGGSNGDDGDAVAAVATAENDEEPTPSADVTGLLLTTATMRIGPGLDYAIMGTVPEGAVVVLAGRNEDNTWLQVVYPAGSQLRGWIPVDQVEVSGDLTGLVIAGPGEPPEIDVPTYIEPWTWTPEPYVPPPENTPPPPPTRVRAVATNTAPAPPTNTAGPPPTSTPPPGPPGQGGGAAVSR
jgi:uncharacterized protein YraI